MEHHTGPYRLMLGKQTSIPESRQKDFFERRGTVEDLASLVEKSLARPRRAHEVREERNQNGMCSAKRSDWRPRTHVAVTKAAISWMLSTENDGRIQFSPSDVTCQRL